MAKPKTRARISTLPGGLDASRLSLDELRSAKVALAFLGERIDGPPAIAEYIRAFRFLHFFGLACVAEDKYPPLTRCWRDMERLFMNDPTFDDGVFVQSWILIDFPFGPEGQTALDYFDELLGGSDASPQLQRFIVEARKSRLGLHQDVLRTKKVAKFRELLSGKVTSAFPSIDAYGRGEILLARMIAHGSDVFVFGHPKGFPKEAKTQIEDMVLGKLFYFDDVTDPAAQYETFMKLAGPYWMSCVTQNDAAPILDPDHYRTYLGGRAVR